MGLTKNVTRTERILRMSGGIAGIFLFLPLAGAARWVSLGLGIFFFVTGVINY
jgi:hypothetical protein